MSLTPFVRPMLALFGAIALVVLVHLCCLAASASALGFSVRTFTYGTGPVLARLGPLHIAALPFGGKVKLKSLDDGTGDKPAPDAFELQPR